MCEQKIHAETRFTTRAQIRNGWIDSIHILHIHFLGRHSIQIGLRGFVGVRGGDGKFGPSRWVIDLTLAYNERLVVDLWD